MAKNSVIGGLSSDAVHAGAHAPGHNSAGSWAAWKVTEVEVAKLTLAAGDPRSYLSPIDFERQAHIA